MKTVLLAVAFALALTACGPNDDGICRPDQQYCGDTCISIERDCECFLRGQHDGCKDRCGEHDRGHGKDCHRGHRG